MSTDDTPIPDNDPVAFAARHALGEIAELAPAGPLSWDAVQAGARRVRRRRLVALGAACAIVLVGAGAAVAATAHDSGNRLNVAAGDESTTAAPTAATTTLVPPTDNSSSAPNTTPRTDPTGIVGSTTTVPAPPDATPQARDVTGFIEVGPLIPPGDDVSMGTELDVSANVRNVSDHAIWASSSLVPTAYATVCTTEGADPNRSLWWMTNILVDPGASDARSSRFTATAAYTGTVTCEIDLVTTDGRGITFDTSAGGDEATAMIVGRVTAIPTVTFTIVPSDTTTSTTTPADSIPTTTVP